MMNVAKGRSATPGRGQSTEGRYPTPRGHSGRRAQNEQLVPLTVGLPTMPGIGAGSMLLVTRGESEYSARQNSLASFYGSTPCVLGNLSEGQEHGSGTRETREHCIAPCTWVYTLQLNFPMIASPKANTRATAQSEPHSRRSIRRRTKAAAPSRESLTCYASLGPQLEDVCR